MQITSNKSLSKRALALLLSICIILTLFQGCISNNTETSKTSVATGTPLSPTVSPIATQEIAEAITQEILNGNEAYVSATPVSTPEITETEDLTEVVKELVENEFALKYDVFNATVCLSDGIVLSGIGYSDYSAYYETDDGNQGFWPAGFIAESEGEYLNNNEDDSGVIVYNDDYDSPDFGFVYAYKPEPFLTHCVYHGQYVKYGVDDSGTITYTTEPYKRGQCDEALGALYSYDEGRFVFDPNVGAYLPITGVSLFTQLDYEALRKEVDRILAEQDAHFVQEEIKTNAYFAQEAVTSYLLSLQEETFLGCDVATLVEEVKKLDPTQCFRLTPEGYIIVPFDEKIPEAPSDLAKWTVGVCCGIAVAGSIALRIFVPAATPAAGAISGAAIDIFLQVVVENRSLDSIQWSKVAVSAISGACLAWACPLGASQVTTSLGKAGASVALQKLAGYGFLTFSNAIVSGVTNSAFAIIDGKDSTEVGNAFLFGAAVGACCTAAASLLSEGAHALGNLLNASHPNNWMVKVGNAVGGFIGKHQVHLKNAALEEILSPKTVYQAARATNTEVNAQAIQSVSNERQGGSYRDVKITSDSSKYEVHDIPSHASSGDKTRGRMPAIKMSIEDHKLTASYGPSNDARNYRIRETQLIQEGKMKEAIQMGIDDIHLKFGSKYDDAIEQMIEYARTMGWW